MRVVIGSALLAAVAFVGCSDDDAAEPVETSASVTTAADDGATAGGWHAATADADLELRVVADLAPVESGELAAGPDQVVLTGPDGATAYLLGPVELDGTIVDRARSVFDDLNGWSVAVEMKPDGAEAFDALAAEVVGEQLAIVSDGIVWSAPFVQVPSFGGSAVISGDFSPPEADRLARLVAGVP